MARVSINSQGFVSSLIVLLLLAGVGVGTFLVGQRTNLLPQAAENKTSALSGVSESLITGVQIPSSDVIDALKSSPYRDVTWVKFQYPWAIRDQKKLDLWIDKAVSSGYQVLLSVAKKPKSLPDGQGYEEYSKFMEDLARHEGDRVKAYEIWNEPNFRGEMEGFGDNSPGSYLKILKAGSEGVKRGNPSAIVISAGLAPLTDEYDDEKFFKELASLGGFGYVDGVGVHANINENIAPADASVRGFQRIKIALSLGKPVWITEFGWNRDSSGISREIQEKYIKEAFLLGPKLGNVKAMFIWNFGFGKSGLDVANIETTAVNWDIYNPSITSSSQSFEADLTSECGVFKDKLGNSIPIPCYKVGVFDDNASLQATKDGAARALSNYQTYTKVLADINNTVKDAQVKSVAEKAAALLATGQGSANACIK